MTAPRPGSAPLPSHTVGIDAALSGSEVLASLTRRIAASKARLAAVAPLLGPALAAQVQPGPLDDQGWVLLAPNQAVAAKLRQWLPTIQARLRSQGFDDCPVRVRLLLPR